MTQTELQLDQPNLVTFVIVDSSGVEVTGLGTDFTVSISKAGAAFALGTGTRAEIAQGFYSYILTAAESDTPGQISITIVPNSGSGIQQNLTYQIVTLANVAAEVTYTVTDALTTNPIESAQVTIFTDSALSNAIWVGATNAFGIAQDAQGNGAYLVDTGDSYYFVTLRGGYTFPNPDEVPDPSAGSLGTEGTPIAAGIASGVARTKPLPYTLLSLVRYAEIMGLNPLRFWGTTANNLNPSVLPGWNGAGTDFGGAQDAWPRYAYQSPKSCSLLELAQIIRRVELELATYIGMFPAPMYIKDERHDYPRPNRQAQGYRFINQGHGFMAQWGGIRRFGNRKATLIGTATTGGGSLAYTDEDSDGFFETATITMTTTVTDTKELHVYFSSKDANPDWEIRHPRDITISGGTATLTFDSWQFTNPDLLAAFPTSDGVSLVDISTVANFVPDVDLYQLETDVEDTLPVTYYWRNCCCGSAGTCPACAKLTQQGCATIDDGDESQRIFYQYPATLSNGTASRTQWANSGGGRFAGVAPDSVVLSYLAGMQSQPYEQGWEHDPLSFEWATVIAEMATARLRHGFIGSGAALLKGKQLQVDTALTPDEGDSYTIQPRLQMNPFGTRLGEVRAFQYVNSFFPVSIGGGVI